MGFESAYFRLRMDTVSSSERSLRINQITKDKSMLKTASAL